MLNLTPARSITSHLFRLDAQPNEFGFTVPLVLLAKRWYLVKVSISAKLIQRRDVIKRALHISPDARYRTRRREGNWEDCFETSDREVALLRVACSRSSTDVAAADKMPSWIGQSKCNCTRMRRPLTAPITPRVSLRVHRRRPAVFFFALAGAVRADLVELSALKAW